MTNLSKSKNNVTFIFVDRCLKLITGLVIGAFVARYLGPNRYGFLSYIVALTSLFLPFAKLGLDGVVSKKIAEDPVNTNTYLSNAFILKLIGGLIGLALVVLITFHSIPNEFSFWVVIFIGISLPLTSLEVYDFYFRSSLKSREIFAANALSSIIGSTARLFLIAFAFPLSFFAAATSFELALSRFGIYWQGRKNKLKLSLSKASLKKSKDLIDESWPFMFSSVFAIMLLNLDQVMISNITGNTSTGIYSAMVRITSALTFVPMSLTWGTQSILVEAKKESPKQYEKVLRQLFQLIAVLAFSISLFTIVFSSQLIQIIFGNEYSSGSLILIILAIAQIFSFIGIARGPWVVNEKKSQFELRSNILAFIINLILNFVCIPLLGAVGAAISSLIAYSYTFLLSGFTDKSTQYIAKIQLDALLLKDLHLILPKRFKQYWP